MNFVHKYDYIYAIYISKGIPHKVADRQNG